MEFQLSYFKSWKMMLWKCCTQYASKFGKLSSGHRTAKGQFSLQSQRKAMPKNAQTTVPEAIKCKAISKMEGPPLQTMKRSQPNINWRSRGCLYFSTGCRFTNLDPQAPGSPIASKGTLLHLPPQHGTAASWEPWAGPACLLGPSALLSLKPLQWGREGGNLLPAGRRGKISIEIPVGLTAAAAQTLTRKWFYLFYFSLSTLSCFCLC